MPPEARRRVAVVGAGIVGTSIALELAKRGAEVTLVDRDEPGSGCSFGNSGAVSPGSVAPLAMPGVLASVPGMMLNAESPLFLPLRYLPHALPWLLRFVASARPSHVRRSAEKLAALHAGALDAHEAMARELGVPELFLRRGHLHLYPDAQALAKDLAGWRMREEYGFEVERLDRAGIESLEPGIAEAYQVGMYMRRPRDHPQPVPLRAGDGARVRGRGRARAASIGGERSFRKPAGGACPLEAVRPCRRSMT